MNELRPDSVIGAIEVVTDGGLSGSTHELPVRLCNLREKFQARLLPPPPYGKENPPQKNDLVLVQHEDGKQIGFVECVGPAGKSANVRFAYDHPSEPVTEHFMARELTLIFRAPKGDSK